MSRPWRDRLTIGLAPSRLAIAREALGLRGWRRSGTSVPVTPAAGGPAWRGALAALEAIVLDRQAHRASVRVVLSNHFVRYAVIPWRGDLRSRAERLAFVRHDFVAQWGEAAKDWTVREAAGEHGRASLACAVDRELLDGIRKAFAGSRHALASVQPLFMAAFNEHRRQLGRRGVLLVSEPGRLCGAAFEDGEWRSTFATRVDGTMAPEAMERELLLAGAPCDAPAFLCGVDAPVPERLVPGLKVLSQPPRAAHGTAFAWIGGRA